MDETLTWRPANSKPSICSSAILASSDFLYLISKSVMRNYYSQTGQDALDKRITFAAAGHGIPMKIDKLKFSKGFEHLLDIAFSEIKM